MAVRLSRAARAGLFAWVLAASIAAHAQMHMCKDAQGRKVFSDQPCGADDTIVNVSPPGGPSINPSHTITVEHYEIRGNTWPQLQREIDAKGPEGWWGNANTQIAYELEWKPTAGGCRITSVRVKADARIRLPQWANRFEGPASLQAYWDNVYRSLDLHERGHVRISLEGAKELERALREVPELPTCDAVSAEARRTYERIGSALKQRQVAYDAQTNHGRDQWTPYRD